MCNIALNIMCNILFTWDIYHGMAVLYSYIYIEAVIILVFQ